MKHVKDVLNALAKKYVTKDAGSEKSIVGKFIDYKMVDNKSMKDQITEFYKLANECLLEDMFINEKFQTVTLIKKTLKHKRKYLSLEELIIQYSNRKNNRFEDNSK